MISKNNFKPLRYISAILSKLNLTQIAIIHHLLRNLTFVVTLLICCITATISLQDRKTTYSNLIE